MILADDVRIVPAVLPAAACLLLALQPQPVWSSDACSDTAIIAAADVSVSDGTSFEIESFFHSSDGAAIRHIREPNQLVVVEGPLSWARVGDKEELGGDFHKSFALGHQNHALMLRFDEIASNARRTTELNFRGNQHGALSGDYPYGGVIHLVDGETRDRPTGLLFEFPESAPISITFGDWRESGGRDLPYLAQIDDGERVFDYRYSSIDLRPKSPLWFFEQVAAPAIDDVRVYRLHRKLLAAHCLGDAELMASLSAPDIVIANRGDLNNTTSNAMQERFTALFERLDYTAYLDIESPVIEVAESADLGWIAVNVRALGTDRKTGAAFDDQWAWIMMVKKVGGEWLNAGNASNRKQ